MKLIYKDNSISSIDNNR